KEPSKLDDFLRAGAMPIVSVPLALWCATAGTMHPTHLPAPHRRRTTKPPGPLSFCFAPGSGMRPFHAVDGHFVSAPPPTTGTHSISLSASASPSTDPITHPPRASTTTIP